MRLLLDLLALVRALGEDRARLALENLVLRPQLNVLRRSVKRVRLEDSDRIFWVLIPTTYGCDSSAESAEYQKMRSSCVARAGGSGPAGRWRTSRARRKKTRASTPSVRSECA